MTVVFRVLHPGLHIRELQGTGVLAQNRHDTHFQARINEIIA
jgi:hypothetical protein